MVTEKNLHFCTLLVLHDLSEAPNSTISEYGVHPYCVRFKIFEYFFELSSSKISKEGCDKKESSHPRSCFSTISKKSYLFAHLLKGFCDEFSVVFRSSYTIFVVMHDEDFFFSLKYMCQIFLPQYFTVFTDVYECREGSIYVVYDDFLKTFFRITFIQSKLF